MQPEPDPPPDENISRRTMFPESNSASPAAPLSSIHVPGSESPPRDPFETLTLNSAPTSLPTGEARRPPKTDQQRLPQVPGYEVLEFVAQGGMGVVYRARDLTLQRPVAIKLPRAGFIHTSDDKERFLREARSAARLRHPNICPIYEVREVDGEPCICMAFIEGATLKQWVEQQQSGPRQIAELVATVATTVHFAHEQGVLHRDLKPANVLVETHNGQPLLMDFGLAKDLGQEEGLTVSGAVLGTPAYMAPEQAAGRSQHIGPQSDVYALGVILYELLSGALPFRGTVAEILVKQQVEEPLSLRKLNPQLHPDLEIICQKAMAKIPGDRYATAADLAADLTRFARGEPIVAKRQPWVKRLGRVLAKNRVVAVLAGSLLLVIASVLVALPVLNRQLRISRLSSQLQLQLKNSDWKPNQVPAAVNLLKDLEELSHEDAQAGRELLEIRLNEYIEERLKRGRLTDTDVTNIQQDIRVLGSLNASLAQQQTEQLERQIGLWERLVTLDSGFENAEKLLPGVRIKDDGSALLGPPNWIDPDYRPKSVFLTPDGSPGNFQLQARVNLPKKCAVGLIISASKRHDGCVTAIAVSPNGEHFVSADALGTLRLFQAASGNDLGSLPGHSAAISGLAYSPDGKWLVSCGLDGEVHVLDVATQKVTQVWRVELPLDLIRGQAMFFGPPLAFSAHGSQLLAGSGDGVKSGEIRRWQFPSGEVLPPLRPAQPTPFIVQLSTSANGRVAAGTWDNRVQLWDLTTQQQSVELALHPADHPPNLPVLALHPKGNVIAAATHGAIHLVNEQGAEFAVLEGYAAGVYALTFDPEGKTLAAGYEGGTVKLWDVGLRQLKHTIPDNRRRCEALAFGPRGDWLVGGVEQGTLHLWEMASGQERYVIDGKGYHFTATRAEDGPITLQITRGTTVLRDQIIEVDADLIELSARREGDRLELQVNRLPPLVFHDYFPPQPIVRGRWGVILEPFTELQQLIVRRSLAPAPVNPLQEGDLLLNSGQYASALDSYQRQESNAGDDPASLRARQEAALKQAICLLRLNREKEAEAKLRETGGGPAEHDPAVVMARFLLWEMLIRQDKRSEADQLFDATRIEFPTDFVAEVIPVDTRARILTNYAAPLFRRTGLAQAGSVAHLQTALEMNEYLLLPEVAVVDWRMTYLAALRISEQQAQVQAESKRLLESLDQEAQQGDIRLKPVDQLRSFLKRYGVVSRVYGEPQRVEGYLKVVLLDDNGQLLPNVVGPRLALLLELARVHASRQEWQLAHDVVQPLLTAEDRTGIPREVLGDAVLLDGFALRHLQREAEAIAAWKKHPYPTVVKKDDLNTLVSAEILQFWILRSLAGDMTDIEAEAIVAAVRQRLAGSGTATKLVDVVPVQNAFLQQAWRTGPGLQMAESLALGERLPAEVVADAIQIGAYTAVSQGAFAGPLTPEQEAAVWKQTQASYRSFSNDEVSVVTLSLFGLAWKGTPPPFTPWEALLKQLPEATRPGGAYVLGCRYVRRGRPADARTLYTLARDWAGADAALKQLAEVELAKLPP